MYKNYAKFSPNSCIHYTLNDSDIAQGDIF